MHEKIMHENEISMRGTWIFVDIESRVITPGRLLIRVMHRGKHA